MHMYIYFCGKANYNQFINILDLLGFFLNVQTKIKLNVWHYPFQVLSILARVKNSMHEMAGFSPEDVIFLLNKWDLISYKNNDRQEQFFNRSKNYIYKLWREFDESRIFKTSATKVLHYE